MKRNEIKLGLCVSSHKSENSPHHLSLPLIAVRILMLERKGKSILVTRGSVCPLSMLIYCGVGHCLVSRV